MSNVINAIFGDRLVEPQAAPKDVVIVSYYLVDQLDALEIHIKDLCRDSLNKVSKAGNHMIEHLTDLKFDIGSILNDFEHKRKDAKTCVKELDYIHKAEFKVVFDWLTQKGIPYTTNKVVSISNFFGVKGDERVPALSSYSRITL